MLTEEDGIDMEIELQDTIEKYGLNFEQAGVLRNFALTVVRAPGWSPSSSEPPPILLVHGTFPDDASDMLFNRATSCYLLNVDVYWT